MYYFSNFPFIIPWQRLYHLERPDVLKLWLICPLHMLSTQRSVEQNAQTCRTTIFLHSEHDGMQLFTLQFPFFSLETREPYVLLKHAVWPFNLVFQRMLIKIFIRCVTLLHLI